MRASSGNPDTPLVHDGFMTRAQRVDPIDGWHHLMNRGVNRSRIFRDDDDREEFLRCSAFAAERHRVELHGFCLMTNHFHLLAKCPGGNVSEFMKLSCGMFAQSVNRRHDRVGHLFGDRFTSRLISSEIYIVNAIRYIHRNALDLPGITRCDQHRWSSHPSYAGTAPTPKWLRTDTILDWFDGRGSFAQSVDPQYVTASTAPDPTRPPHSHDALTESADDLLAAVDIVLAEHSRDSGRATMRQRRAIALYIGARPGRLRSDLLERLDITTAAAARSADWRRDRHFADHPDQLMLAHSVAELLRPHRRFDQAS